jgi:hypothetical protein
LHDTLGTFITDAFFPELRPDLKAGIEHFQYRRHAWNAIALALVEMARRWPRVVHLLRRPGFPSMPLIDELLARGECAEPPDNLPVEPVL